MQYESNIRNEPTKQHVQQRLLKIQTFIEIRNTYEKTINKTDLSIRVLSTGYRKKRIFRIVL